MPLRWSTTMQTSQKPSIASRCAMSHAGQVCISVQRVLIHDSIYASFKEAFSNGSKLPVGDPPRGCRLRSDDQPEAKTRVQDWIDEAIQKGAMLNGAQMTPPTTSCTPPS